MCPSPYSAGVLLSVGLYGPAQNLQGLDWSAPSMSADEAAGLMRNLDMMPEPSEKEFEKALAKMDEDHTGIDPTAQATRTGTAALGASESPHPPIAAQPDSTAYEPAPKRARTDNGSRPGTRLHAYDAQLSASDLSRGTELPPPGQELPVKIDRQGVRLGERDRCFHIPHLSTKLSDYSSKRDIIKVAKHCIGAEALRQV
ncbi:hypothetical protein JCM3774_004603 [Rhodotorula dairenensis]